MSSADYVIVGGDSALERAVRATGACVWHPVGTCRMGSDEHAVVDSQLRVRGLRSLRVVDASVMPQITSSNFPRSCWLSA